MDRSIWKIKGDTLRAFGNEGRGTLETWNGTSTEVSSVTAATAATARGATAAGTFTFVIVLVTILMTQFSLFHPSQPTLTLHKVMGTRKEKNHWCRELHF
jgi:cystathionine beta-lyase family protein involved in aluminum resistance